MYLFLDLMTKKLGGYWSWQPWIIAWHCVHLPPPCHKNQTLHPVRLRKSTHLWRDWTCETFDKNINFVTNLSKQDIFCWNHCRRGNSYRIRTLILISLKTLKNMQKRPNSWNLRTGEPKKLWRLQKICT